MPAPKKPTTFDAHLGALIADSARRKGGRPFIAQLIGVSTKTVDRRALGDGSYTVKEINLIAAALNTTPTALAEQALKNYADGTVEEGMAKLLAEEGHEVMSEPPVSLDARRSKSIADMSDEELEGLPNAANTDPEIGHDEPETT